MHQFQAKITIILKIPGAAVGIMPVDTEGTRLIQT